MIPAIQFKTTNGVVFVVDIADVPLLVGLAFHMRGDYIGVYRAASAYGAKDQWSGYLHLHLFGDVGEDEVDHKDRDKRNNTRANLRRVTKSVQNLNRASWGALPQGITYEAGKQSPYRARAQFQFRRVSLGRYRTLEEAVEARKWYDEQQGHGP